ncbi:MAG: glucodextranase DOMON-like domain-containing protein [Anaerolineae bacterium]
MLRRFLWLMAILGLLLTSCTTETPSSTATVPPPTAISTSTSTPEPTPTPEPELPLYLAIIWHQHQPVYFKDPETGVYAKPWVRVHAAKDYVDMAAMLEAYPDVKATFNLTPSLIRQLDDLAQGAGDAYGVHTEVPAAELTDEQKRFILRYFFDINPKIIARFPRYVELQERRPADDAQVEAAIAGGWTEADFRDLQVLFNLAWTDPTWLAEEPLASLVEKGRDFTEEDKQIVLDEHLRLIREVIPVHKALQQAGQIEVTTTPFAHPILPLLMDTTLAKVAMPAAELPDPPFRYPQDARAQLERGVAFYQEHFGAAPRGLWPAEGSVAQDIVPLVSEAGIRWMASDEGVLAQSLGMEGFTRNADETVQEADALYRPYTVAGRDGTPVAMVFRDVVISDKVGFSYSGMPGEEAAADFMARLHAIRDQLEAEGTEGPHLVTVILDGENAWEHYENDGKAFLNALYAALSEDETIETVTPSEYLTMFPTEPSREIEDLWPGSWISHDFSTWIGEEEENRAWDYLRRTREAFGMYERGVYEPPDEAALVDAREQMYIAEGSDWFWWYGADQNSGDDQGFDQQFRDTLKQVYLVLGETPPLWLSVPIIAAEPAPPEQTAGGLISPTVDGIAGEAEWAQAGAYSAAGGAMAGGSLPLERLYYGFNAESLHLRLDAVFDWGALTTCGGNPNCRSTVGVYFSLPDVDKAGAFSRWGDGPGYLGFGATRLLELTFGNNAELLGVDYSAFDGDGWVPVDAFAVEEVSVAVADQTLELSLPLTLLGKDGAAPDSGTRFELRAVLSQGTTEAQSDRQFLPVSGPARVTIPDLGLTTAVLEVQDPEEDDYGPGTYTYPTDGVFKPGAFDVTAFSVGYDETNVVFRLQFRGPLENVWDSPYGLSLQTVDIYVDQDGPENGARRLLPGRNAALNPDHAWDYAIWVEGWEPGLYAPGETEPQQVAGVIPEIIVDPGLLRLTIKVPQQVLGDDPDSWAYAAVVLSQDGFPSTGVWRVRDVEPTATQWKLGGAPDDVSHTRVLDLVWPVAGQQEALLSAYTSSEQLSNLTADDFAQLPMLTTK